MSEGIRRDRGHLTHRRPTALQRECLPGTPVHGVRPRGTRPAGHGLSRSHTDLTRSAGAGCRRTQGLDDVWSARHARVNCAAAETPHPEVLEFAELLARVVPTDPVEPAPRAVEPMRTDHPTTIVRSLEERVTTVAAGFTTAAIIALVALVVAGTSAAVVSAAAGLCLYGGLVAFARRLDRVTVAVPPALPATRPHERFSTIRTVPTA